MSVLETDRQAASLAKGPRISVADIEAAIAQKFEMTADVIAPSAQGAVLQSLKLMSICLVVMKNGFVVIGKSAPISKENYNFALGCKFAYEDAIRQLWPLMAFALKDKGK